MVTLSLARTIHAKPITAEEELAHWSFGFFWMCDLPMKSEGEPDDDRLTNHNVESKSVIVASVPLRV